MTFIKLALTHDVRQIENDRRKCEAYKSILLGKVGFYQDRVAEWLRRWTANPLGFPRVDSNPIPVEKFLFDNTCLCYK